MSGKLGVAHSVPFDWQRYYDAEIGRFLIPDLVGPEEDFINHFNRYNYAMNNPVRYTDPDGRDAKKIQSADPVTAKVVDGLVKVESFIADSKKTISGLMAGEFVFKASFWQADLSISESKGIQPGINPTQSGVFVGLMYEFDNGIELPFSKTPVEAPVTMDYEVSRGAGVAGGANIKYNPGGTIEARPMIGLGAGAVQSKTPAVTFSNPNDAPTGSHIKPRPEK